MDAQGELDEGQDEADGGNDKTEHVQKSGGKSSETKRKMSDYIQRPTVTNKTKQNIEKQNKRLYCSLVIHVQ